MEIKELSRRCELIDGVGMACGPVFYTAIEAEMVVQFIRREQNWRRYYWK